MGSSRVDLGFAEECASYLLTNHYFPSKIGGKPAWLNLENIPQPEDLQCPKCHNPMSFLCQIYAPIESDPNAFHRTIYLFICKSLDCCALDTAENITAVRNQLARENDFYPPIAPDEKQVYPVLEPMKKLCIVCGCRGPMKCSQCKSAFYCSKSHQRIDWKYGHKQICQDSTTVCQPSASPILFPEYDIKIEPEPANAVTNIDDNLESQQKRMEEFEKLEKEGKIGDLCYISETALLRYSGEIEYDKTFMKFKKRIAECPEQVLRYERKGEPLLIAKPASENMFTIPNCAMCGSNRVYEFQIMPQLLNYLRDDALDWGTIIVYTCSKSCNTSSTYVKEYVVKQNVGS